MTLPSVDDLDGWNDFLDQQVLGGLQRTRQRIEALRATAPGDPASLPRWNDVHVDLGNAFAVAGLLSQVHPDAALRERAEGYEQQLHELRTSLMLDPGVYAVLEAAPTDGLPDGAERVLEDALRSFQRSGVDRDEKTRARLRELSARGSDLGQAFARNIRDGAGETRVPASALEGLPADYVESHPVAEDGTVTITTGYPDTNPFLMFSADREARHAVMHTFLNIGWPDNDPVLADLLKVRDEQARLLGYDSWPDYDAEEKMIGTGAAIAEFVDRVARDATASAERDAAVLLERARQDHPDLERLDVADARYYGEVVRREQYDVDGQAVRAYFDSGRVRQGLLDVTGRLFGLEYLPVDAPSWHAEVATYETPASTRVSTIEGSCFQPATSRLAPTGLAVSSRTLTRSSRPSAVRVSMMPMPPASDTAAASRARAMKVIGAWTMGISTPSSCCRCSTTCARAAPTPPWAAVDRSTAGSGPGTPAWATTSSSGGCVAA